MESYLRDNGSGAGDSMKNRFSAYFSLLCVLMMGISVISLLPIGADGADTGYFHVLVTESGTQDPIENAMVWIDDEVVWYTLKDGTATFRDIAFGSHKITVLAQGYIPINRNIEFDRNGTQYHFMMDKEEPVREGVIKGRVILEVYDPPHDAGEAIIGFESMMGVPMPGIVDVFATDDPLIGEYFVIVAPGDHHLWCFAHGHVPSHSPTLSVHAGEVVYHDFIMKYTGMHNSGLTGNVTDGVTGVPIGNATIMATNGIATLTTITDAHGFYFFAGPDAGTYTVLGAASGYYPASGSGTVNWGEITYVDLELKPSQEDQTVLWGFVYGDGTPLPTAQVFSDVPHVVGTNTMGIAGLYVIEDFPGDMDHIVGATAAGFFPQSTMVNVPTGTIQRQDFYLQKGSEREFAVVIASVWENGTGVELNDSTINLVHSYGYFSDSVNTGPSSNVHIWVGIPAWGLYWINSVHPGYHMVGFDHHPGPVVMGALNLTSSEVNIVKLFMEKEEGEDRTSIWGYVTSAAFGTAISGCPILDITTSMTVFSTTDGSGFYHEHVSPGTYTHIALPSGGYSMMNYDHATGIWGWGPWTGTVAPGESRQVDYVIKEQKESFLIAGQVVYHGSGAPVAGFDVEALGPSTPTMHETTPASGFFLFSPLWDPGSWTVDGSHPGLYVVDVEYHLMVGGPTTSSSTLPVMFNMSVPDAMWVRISVQQEVPNNRTRIWGYVYVGAIGGPIVPSCPILDITSSMTLFDVTDSTGHYDRIVTPGDFTLTPLAVGGYSIMAYDWTTGVVSAAPWSGTVLPGTSRHVDFLLKQDREAAVIAGQVTMYGTGDPVDGFTVGANSGTLTYTQSTPASGLFFFSPIYLFSNWQISGFHPSLSVLEVKYYLYPGGASTTSTTLPVTFPLSSSQIMWVDITVGEGQQKPGKLHGKVFKLYTYAPGAGSTVEIYQMPGMVLTYTLTADTNGNYGQVLMPGDYYVKASLSGYAPGSALVNVPSASSIYQPLYLTPRIPIPVPLNITVKFVEKDNNTPMKDLKIEVIGIGGFVTDDEGLVTFGIPEEGEYTINIAAAHAVLYDENGNEIGPLNAPVKLEMNRTYTAKVTLYQRILVDNPTTGGTRGVSAAMMGGGVAAALLIGGLVGFALRGGSKKGKFDEE